MSHANAPLTPQSRLLLCQRIEAGSPMAHVASAMGISRRCASKWWHRYLELIEVFQERSAALVAFESVLQSGAHVGRQAPGPGGLPGTLDRRTFECDRDLLCRPRAN